MIGVPNVPLTRRTDCRYFKADQVQSVGLVLYLCGFNLKSVVHKLLQCSLYDGLRVWSIAAQNISERRRTLDRTQI